MLSYIHKKEKHGSVRERQLSYTAVALFPMHIVTYVHTHIKTEIYTKKLSEFVQYMYIHIYSYFAHYVIYLFER